MELIKDSSALKLLSWPKSVIHTFKGREKDNIYSCLLKTLLESRIWRWAVYKTSARRHLSKCSMVPGFSASRAPVAVAGTILGALSLFCPLLHVLRLLSLNPLGVHKLKADSPLRTLALGKKKNPDKVFISLNKKKKKLSLLIAETNWAQRIILESIFLF